MQLKASLLLFALAALTNGLPQSVNPDPDTLCEPGPTTKQTIKDGNGNPHQNFIFKQISGTTDCTNNPSGSASIQNGMTVGWIASAGFSTDFLTGGFSVTESVTTGSTNAFGCKTNSGTHTGSLCVFERIQVTAFTAKQRECSSNSCTGTHCGNYDTTGVIFAPNTVQGSCYYDNFQLNLPCGVEGSEHHIDSGPAGGPQFIACNPSHV
jgi:hypothetical protein